MSEQQKDQAQQIDVEDLEVSAEESHDIKGGKVTMQDFHFVMRANSTSPK